MLSKPTTDPACTDRPANGGSRAEWARRTGSDLASLRSTNMALRVLILHLHIAHFTEQLDLDACLMPEDLAVSFADHAGLGSWLR